MNEEKFSYEGSISNAYITKEMIKTFMVLIILLIPITLFTLLITWVVMTDGGDIPIQNLSWVWIALFFIVPLFVLIPFICILILNYFYLSAYVNSFLYMISEDNIQIYHGVFTKVKATIPYTRIQNIKIVNGVFDRAFHMNTVKIETAGGSGVAASAQKGLVRPEGYIPGLKDPNIIESKIKEMMTRYSQIPSGLEDKIFKPQELAFDSFVSYILSKMREGENLRTKIKELRGSFSMSAAQLAEKVGVPIQTINYLEEGRYNPSLALAYKIAEVLRCKIEELFEFI